ncbi:S8/S53 family peptidase [Nonomuraea sp. NEAU-A123]|uniref:S8/S53 family peptidase n=1 Tax=Nonomuraea sp. NEAU-A123 TaxID=2839649 RepID=UPI001BE46E70|nr:S8/S53 family peptidase [Nonomuraea sp. NEAU-A123]MBT2229872.1 S8/S53 family peptidase [Nonomuraea sp. NEAU-A123]
MLTIDYESEPYAAGDRDGLPSRDLIFPQPLLDRYGAKVLDPATAELDAGESRPAPTVYRSDVLLIPVQVLNSDAGFAWITSTLAQIHLTIEVSGLRDGHRPGEEHDRGGEAPSWHPAVLKVAPGETDVVIDAWRALRTLRRALPGFSDAPGQAPVKNLLSRIALDHLLVGSAFVGVGAALDIGGEPATSGHGTTGGAYATPMAGYARTPVNVVGGPPARRPAANIGGRRPVMVIPDTGLPKQWHAWFRPVTDPDAFLSVSDAAQQRIQLAVEASQPNPGAELVGYKENADPPNPLLGTLNTHTGHGLMEAGLVCQVAPDSRVLMIRVMQADGVVPEEALHAALDHLLDEIAQGGFYDVVSLSLGYTHETADDPLHTPPLLAKLTQLRRRGVIVVASAGNYASSRAFWPAAGALDGENDPDLAPMLGVGAANPDGTIAIFSNEHEAIRWHVSGAVLVSTFPPGVKGARTASLELTGRASYDSDNHQSQFATWSGSSFAAPVLGATIMQLLIQDHQAVDLANTDRQVALKRAHAVVARLKNGDIPTITPV